MRPETIARHGLTDAAFDALLAAQGYGCAICWRALYVEVAPQIDHDHGCCSGATGCGACVRGVLCNGCNSGLECFRDDPALLARAIVEQESSLLYPIATAGRCAVCDAPTTGDRRRCAACAFGFGHFGYDAARMRAAIAYLEGPR